MSAQTQPIGSDAAMHVPVLKPRARAILLADLSRTVPEDRLLEAMQAAYYALVTNEHVAVFRLRLERALRTGTPFLTADELAHLHAHPTKDEAR